MQEEVTQAIVRAIAPQIEMTERLKAARRHPANLSAYEIAVRAWANAVTAFFNNDAALRERVIGEADQALAIDPSSTLALNAIAFTQFQNAFFEAKPEVRELAWQQGMVAAQRAMELDPSDSLGYSMKGMYLLFPPHPPGTPGHIDRNDEALHDLQRAHDLNPNDIHVLRLLGVGEVAVGLVPQAIERFTQALRNNPRGPWSANIEGLLSWAHFFAKNYAAGRQWALRALTGAPNLYVAHICLAVHCVGLGEISQAKNAFEAVRRIAPDFVASRLSGGFYTGSVEDRNRHQLFLRIAAGLEDPSAADAPR